MTAIAANKEAFRAIVAVWESGVTARLSALVSSDYVGHTASGDRDRDGLAHRIAAFHSIYNPVKFNVIDQVGEGDRIATWLEAHVERASDKGKIRLRGMNISRFVDGKQAEEWMVWESFPNR